MFWNSPDLGIFSPSVCGLIFPRFWLSVIRRAKQNGSTRRSWLAALMARRSTKVAAIALANKIARTAWAMMAHGTRYKEPLPQAAGDTRGAPLALTRLERASDG